MAERARAARLLAAIAFKADPWRAAAVTVISVANAALMALTALWLKLLVEGVIASDEGQIRWAVAAFGVTGLVTGVGAWLSFDLRTVLTEKTGMAVDQRMVSAAARVPGLEHYERPEYLDRLSILRQEREHLARTVPALIQALTIVAQVVVTAVLLASVSPLLLALPLFGIPSLAAGAAANNVRQRALEETAADERLARHLFQLATTPGPGKELRVFGLGAEIVERFDRAWARLDRIRTRAGYRAGAIAALGWLCFAAGYVGAIVFVALRAAHGDASPGDVLLTAVLASQVNRQVEYAAITATYLLRALSVAARLLWLDDVARAAAPRAGRAAVPDRLAAGIAFEGVSFTYPGTDTQVLSDVDLRLPAGATVAIVGENGAGKTTLVKLLGRFYEPDAGRITVEGGDLAELDVRAWRARLSAGFQDFARFELIAREVVGVGDLPRLDDERAVVGALERAGAVDVVEGLPAGLEAQLGRSFEEGVDVSGGQWQKLALGRAFMRDEPLVLLLDEPTASLDAETEHALFERYAAGAARARERSGAITVLVTHRFSTVRAADLIVVLDGGRVVATGTHDELVAQGGLYADLYDLQARGYR